MRSTAATPRHVKRAQTKTATSCIHGRMVDEVRSASGAQTGRLVCKECQAEFLDPNNPNNQKSNS